MHLVMLMLLLLFLVNNFFPSLFFSEQAQLDAVSSVLRQVYPEGPLDISDPESHVSHPMNGLGMLHRMGYRLQGAELTPLKAIFKKGEEEENGTETTRLTVLSDRMKRLVICTFFTKMIKY